MKSNNKIAEGNYLIELKSVTWGKDSHGLFDYQSQSLNQKKFYLNASTTVLRDVVGSNIKTKLVEDPKEEAERFQNIATICKKDNVPINQRFTIKHKNGEATAMELEGVRVEQPHLIVRSLKNKEMAQKGYCLEVGDVVKFGRIECIVSELSTFAGGMQSAKKLQEQVNKVYTVTESIVGSCKICLMDEETPDNFFVSPCSCKGSCSTVHLHCLKRWIESKMVVKQHESAVTYNFTKFECEICKDPYPKIIRKNSQSYDLFILKRPTTPYVMLESANHENRENKTMFVINALKPGEFIKLVI